MAMIILVRHGENDWVKKRRLAGWIAGVHLNENGRQQADAMAQRLAALPIKAVYSSPVTRCLETAVYIANTHQLEIGELEELGEVRYGKWEGKKIKKLIRKKSWHTIQFFPSRFRFPSGEALREVQFRAIQTLERLSRQHENEIIAVVSHADVIKLVLAYYMGVHIDLFQRLVISPASISVLALSKNGVMRVVRLNDDGPLQPPPTPKEKHDQEKAEGKEETHLKEEEELHDGPPN